MDQLPSAPTGWVASLVLSLALIGCGGGSTSAPADDTAAVTSTGTTEVGSDATTGSATELDLNRLSFEVHRDPG